MDKTIKLTVNGSELTFNMNLAAYNCYLNEVQPTNKVGPAQNLCMRTVAPESKATLQDLLQQPGMGVMLMASLIEEYMPDIKITVGK